jgi:UDP-N-acetylmuramoyl-tripeptide--D-alanyl-D-alanine ligase
MSRLTLKEAAAAMHGRLTLSATHRPRLGDESEVTGYSIDSRTLEAGDLFFAIVGPRVDGHDFARQAAQKGAAALVVAKGGPGRFPEAPAVLRVNDTTRALQDLGGHVRRRRPLKVIGITGSAGKTTAKEMTGAVLDRRFRTHRSEGNLNNAWGLPLTLLRMPDAADAAVLEMGMSYKGEIARLAEIADPDVGVILNVLPVHLEHFASIAGIAAAKGELFRGLRQDAVAVYNADDARVARLGRAFAGASLPFGIVSRRALVRAEEIVSLGLKGTRFTLRHGGSRAPVRLGIPGRHHVYNALAAAATGFACGLDAADIALGLAQVRPAAMRGVLHRRRDGAEILDDSYNSNPAAMERAIELLAETSPRGRRILAAGDMLELGPAAARAHARIGTLAARAGIDLLVAVGPLSRRMATAAQKRPVRTAVAVAGGRRRAAAKALPATQVRHCESSEEAATFLASEVRPGDLVLVKGSRGIRMERVVRALLGESSPSAPREI